jgi:Septum formation
MNLRCVTVGGASALALLFASAGCSDDESVFNADVGECIEEPESAGNIEDFDEVDCDEDHFGEIFLLVEHEGDDDDFPGSDELQEEAAEECQGEEFEDYTDTEYSESAIFVAQVNPSEESWGEGDRETICILTIGEEVDESFEGNGEDYLIAADDGEGDTSDTTAAEGEETEDFSALIEECEGGDMAACDELYFATPVGSEAEDIGSRCGGRSDEPLFGECESTFG